MQHFGIFLGLFCLATAPIAQAEQVDIPLTVSEAPLDVWSKNRIAPSLEDGALIMRDQGTGPFDDASFWEIPFNVDLPYGRKELAVDIEVGAAHTPLWGEMLMQPLLNGKEAVPALDADGQITTELLISDYDGKGFLPAETGTYTFRMAKSDEQISSFAFMTAGAEDYDVTLSNFRVRVWPEVDDRIWPQRPRASTLTYRAGAPITVMVDWHDDTGGGAEAHTLTLEGPNGPAAIPVTVPRRAAAISGSKVSRVDLGALAPGRYTLTVPATSVRTTEAHTAFEVRDGIAPLLGSRDAAWSAFYWITGGPDGPYPQAHLQDKIARVYGNDDITQNVTGGWYDAGDYGKYAANGAYSVAMMLLTGLVAPEALDHAIDPVAGASADVPDWLRVADAQLGWLVSMQRADGAVHHKATTRKWPSMSTSPEGDLDTKWLMPVTTTATADFAATMFLAAAVYGAQTDPAYVARASAFRAAGERALAWLDTEPDLIMTKSSYNGDAYGGPYDDTDDSDERFFAHAAHAALTGSPEALDRVEALIDAQAARLKSDDFATSWQSVGLLGMWALSATEGLSDTAREQVTGALRAAAYRWRVTQRRSSWQVAVSDDGALEWGSNSVIATVNWHWLLWAHHSGQDDYVDAAERQIHYLFGLNPMDKTYVTGPYRNAARAPHFRPWSSGRIDLPAGFIVGGPNSTNLGGDPLTGALAGEAPMRMYADDVASYATNEVAINWQAAWALSASLLAAALQDTSQKN